VGECGGCGQYGAVDVGACCGGEGAESWGRQGHDGRGRRARGHREARRAHHGETDGGIGRRRGEAGWTPSLRPYRVVVDELLLALYQKSCASQYSVNFLKLESGSVRSS
jgi:hypothetical protein